MATILFICVGLDIVLHIVTTSYSSMPENASFGLVAHTLGTEMTATLWALFAFSCVAFVYLHIRSDIPGAGVRNGLRYGTAIGLLWLFAMLEGVPMFGNLLVNEFVVGLSDAIPVFVLSLLLSKLLKDKSERYVPVASVPKSKMKAISTFAGMFLAGRYIAYFAGVIRSGYHTRPIETFIWTLFMGITIGTVFVFLGNAGGGQSLRQRAMKFGVLAFGLNWAAFLVFMPLLLSGYIADVVLRIVIDTTLVTVSAYLTIVSDDRILERKGIRGESKERTGDARRAGRRPFLPRYKS